jgi:hypothetical protein
MHHEIILTIMFIFREANPNINTYNMLLPEPFVLLWIFYTDKRWKVV